jgi:hypothetical protein
LRERDDGKVGLLQGPVIRQLDRIDLVFDRYWSARQLKHDRVGKGCHWRIELAIGVFVETMRGAQHMSIGNKCTRADADGRTERRRAAHHHHAVEIESERRLPGDNDVTTCLVGRDNRGRRLSHGCDGECKSTHSMPG